jgi:hypothetical protein
MDLAVSGMAAGASAAALWFAARTASPPERALMQFEVELTSRAVLVRTSAPTS